MSWDKESIYRKSPVVLQNLLCSIEGWRIRRARYPADYWKIFESVSARTDLRGAQLHALRTARLRAHLSAASHTEFWRERFAMCGIDVDAKDPWEEFAKLPILSKREVQSALERIKNPGYGASDVVIAHTSGTTGAGLIFPVAVKAMQEQWATWWRYRKWHGIDYSTWCGYFGGRSIVPMKQKKPPYWRMNYPGRQLMFSAYHLNAATAEFYAEALRSHAVTWLHGYPSMLALFAGFVIDQGLNVGKEIEIVTTGAESLQSHQKAVIQKAFTCPVRQHYGMTEGVANISEDVDGVMRVDEDFANVEFIPDDHRQAYRIIGTNWTNPAFPLFRYDTGDLASLDEAMGVDDKWRSVRAVEGRNEDYVTLADGTKLGRLDHIFKDFIEISEAQLYQEDSRSLTIRVVKNNGYTQATERRLIAEARMRLGESLEIKFEYPAKLDRGPNGKLKFVISRVI